MESKILDQRLGRCNMCTLEEYEILFIYFILRLCVCVMGLKVHPYSSSLTMQLFFPRCHIMNCPVALSRTSKPTSQPVWTLTSLHSLPTDPQRTPPLQPAHTFKIIKPTSGWCVCRFQRGIYHVRSSEAPTFNRRNKRKKTLHVTTEISVRLHIGRKNTENDPNESTASSSTTCHEHHTYRPRQNNNNNNAIT